ncbi:hypothetical protein TRVL_04665 [Trypanosoma vivax]|nr:hypothetical protein TRVL_04665 [Trypanosoma vivax]
MPCADTRVCIHELPRLRVLDLSDTTACVRALRKCKSLVSLFLQSCLSGADYSSLANITTLEEADTSDSCSFEACVCALAAAAFSRCGRHRNVHVHSRRPSGSVLHAASGASHSALCLSAHCRVVEDVGTR